MTSLSNDGKLACFPIRNLHAFICEITVQRMILSITVTERAIRRAGKAIPPNAHRNFQLHLAARGTQLETAAPMPSR